MFGDLLQNYTVGHFVLCFTCNRTYIFNCFSTYFIQKSKPYAIKCKEIQYYIVLNGSENHGKGEGIFEVA